MCRAEALTLSVNTRRILLIIKIVVVIKSKVSTLGVVYDIKAIYVTRVLYAKVIYGRIFSDRIRESLFEHIYNFFFPMTSNDDRRQIMISLLNNFVHG